MKREFGIIGLGKMGANLALQGLEKGHRVAGFTLEGAPKILLRKGLKEVKDLSGFIKVLKKPRIILIYIHAGREIDELLTRLSVALEPGDIIADGGNSYWGDSLRRHDKLKKIGIHFVDLGTSGGLAGARSGACFMAGGETKALKEILPVLRSLSLDPKAVYTGPAGSGHFVKLVHNGIEFGMLQAIGEGMDLLENFGRKLDVGQVLRCWQKGSVIRSWLVDLMEASYRTEKGLARVPSHVEDTGEVNWLVSDALQMEIPIPVISQAVVQLFACRDRKKNWARAVAMMRKGFGGHPYGPDRPIRLGRRASRVGDFYNGK